MKTTKAPSFSFYLIIGETPTIVKETEKAVQLEVTLYSQNGHTAITSGQWFPKSAVKEVDGKYFAASWIVNKIVFDRSLRFKPNFDCQNNKGLNF